MLHVYRPIALTVVSSVLLASTFIGAAPTSDSDVVAVAGTDVTVHLFDQADGSGAVVPHYAIRNGRGALSAPQPAAHTIKLRHADFDPLSNDLQPVIPAALASADDTNLYIVQFIAQPLQSFRDAVADAGGTVTWYLPRQCYIVRMDAAARDAVDALPFVRWVGAYHPAYRLEAPLHDLAVNGGSGKGSAVTVSIMMVDAEDDTKASVADAITALNGVVEQQRSGKYLLRATLTPDQLREIARRDEVLYIDRWGPYEPDMNLSRELSGANYVESVAGYTGEGVVGEVFDVGFNVGHVDFASRPLMIHGSAGSNSHGAATSGIVFGDGTGNSQARGIMPDGQGIVSNSNGFLGQPTRYDHTGDLLEAPFYGVLQTSSVGSPRTFFYTTLSADKDAALFDFDVLHCQSQSNAGNQDSRPQAWAKNVVSGGGVFHYNTLDKSDDCWCNGGSIGPASDGRIKPDLCHFYDATLTVTSGGSNAYTTSFGGTSGATPNIAGYTGLFFEMWSDGIFGNEYDPFATVFENRCHMTTAKAVMINTAEQYAFSGTSHDLTRVHQGWGMPDIGNIWDLRDKLFIVDESDVIGNLETISYIVAVGADEPEFKATMVFADPPGNPAASEHRINDLTLKVTAPNGTVYWGNNGLLANNYSTPGGSANTIDTVENVFVQNPDAGAWLVEVIASEINEDSHIETAGLDADFALVVSPATPIVDAGVARLDSSAYPCDATAEISVNDSGLNQDDGVIETTVVTIASTSEPGGESVLLTETTADSGAFTGTIDMQTSDGSGILLVSPGDTVTLTYIDADDGQGNENVVVEDNASIDCTMPVISNVQITSVGAFDAWISFETDEDTQGTVRYGTSCGSLVEVQTQAGFGTFHEIHIVGLNEATTYFFDVLAEDTAGNSDSDDNNGLCYSFSTEDIPLYFTEQFSSFDLDGYTMKLTPNGGFDGYDVCIEEASVLPTDPAGGTSLPLSDDDSEIVNVSSPVHLYGVSYSSFFVGSNGYITFGQGDSDYSESLGDHFDLPRISALFDDLNPASGGTISKKELGDRVAVTYAGVPEYSNTGSNTFQVELFFDGSIHITWVGVTSVDSIVGISEGEGVPTEFIEIDLSGLGDCGLTCATDLDGSGATDVNDILILLANWGGDAETQPGDVNDDGSIDVSDLLMILGAWGACS